MRPLIACALLLTAYAQAVRLPGSSEQVSKWEAYKAQHGKLHPEHEEIARFQRFVKADAEIRAHNERFARGLESYSQQLTQYSDLTMEEFSNFALGLKVPENATEVPLAPQMPYANNPESWDWTEHDRVTFIKDQKDCGACYAFGAAAVVESYLKAKTGKDHDLSEQEVVDCSYRKYMNRMNNDGCKGGWPDAVFQHYEVKDILFENEYRYTSGVTETHGTCKIPKRKYNMLNHMKWTNARPRDEDHLAELLYSKGPILVAIYADGGFQRLREGVFTGPQYRGVNHAVVLVGYGTDRVEGPYWLIKNSWGKVWGVEGYGKIYRGANTCNLMGNGVWYVE